MTKLLIIFFIAFVLAYQSEKNTRYAVENGYTYSMKNDRALLLLIAALVLFAGLRTAYNDTENYIRGFDNAPDLGELLSKPGMLDIFKNPLFHIYQGFLKSLGCSSQVLVFTTSLFTQTCFILFLKRYSSDFVFSVCIYFTLGTFCVTLAAIKQTLAMAVLTLAFKHIEQRKWVKFYLVVIIAALFHTYALLFVILPFFTAKTWRVTTYALIGGVVFVLLNFEGVITRFLDEANEAGKAIAEYEVFDGNGVNIVRVLVYLVPPLISFVFQKWLYRDSSPMENVLSHMTVISFCFMLLGTQSGANMFARMAHYFEVGTVCILPWLMQKTLVDSNYRSIRRIAMLCFFAFFVYANGISDKFDYMYQSVRLFPW